nr:hypothetical protein [uncultured Blautia sp.]
MIRRNVYNNKNKTIEGRFHEISIVIKKDRFSDNSGERFYNIGENGDKQK